MKKFFWAAAGLCFLLGLTGCAVDRATSQASSETQTAGVDSVNNNQQERFTGSSTVDEIRTDPVFGSYGRLLFPVDEWYWSGDTLEDLSFVWYSDMDADCTVEIVNTLYARAAAGETVFYDIYSEEEKAEDPAKEDTGLFFFKGDAGARFAVCNAGGGFAYVGAMQDSFPHALELSKRGYNAFALIYRPGAQTACEDLARAISFIFEHAQELQVNTDGYSLWGGSAGGRRAAWLGTYGPPTFACVGESDGIASWRTMKRRLDAMSALGIPTEFHHYPGLGHGFGLGTGTVAEG